MPFIIELFSMWLIYAKIDINFQAHGRLSPRRISVAVHKCAKNAH